MHVSSTLGRVLSLGAALVAVGACGSEVTSSSGGDGGGGGATTTTSTTTSGGGGASSGQGGGSTGGNGAGGVLCNPGLVACDAPAPSCPVGEVASVDGGCWGECVPVLSCTPDDSCEDCSGFCAVYEAWTVEYRCVMPTVTCAALACVCLAQYLCASPYDACSDGDPGSGPMVHCGCPAC